MVGTEIESITLYPFGTGEPYRGGLGFWDMLCPELAGEGELSWIALLINLHKTMGRTIHYHIPKEIHISEKDFEYIDRVQQAYNQHFDWDWERLTLERVSWYPYWPNEHKDSALPKDVSTDDAYTIIRKKLDSGSSLQALEHQRYVTLEYGGYMKDEASASGFTKILYNEWEAFLILRFLTCVSRRYPYLRIDVHDEGDFVLAGHIILEGGKPRIDEANVHERRLWLNEAEPDESIGFYPKEEQYSLRRATKAAERGVFYADIDVSSYLDRKEFLLLGLSRKEMAQMGFQELIKLIYFPGETCRKSETKPKRSIQAIEKGD